jgi:DNA invertase Pin-like site-specific DNA recombinase
MEKAVGYVRVSTEEQQREGISMEAQVDRIKAYAAMQGFELVHIYRDPAVSGYKPLAKREHGRQLADSLAKRDGPKHVIAVKLDRLFRNAKDALTQVEAWDKAKRALHVIDMGGSAINTRSAVGKAFFQMAAAFAEMERNLTSERTRDGLAKLRKDGKASGRILPFGYDAKGGRVINGKRTHRGATLVPNKAEQATLAKIRRMRKAGQSINKIAARLNHAKVPTKRGGRWYPVTIAKILVRAA